MTTCNHLHVAGGPGSAGRGIQLNVCMLWTSLSVAVMPFK